MTFKRTEYNGDTVVCQVKNRIFHFLDNPPRFFYIELNQSPDSSMVMYDDAMC